MAENLFITVFNMSLTGSLMILACLLLRLFLRKKPRIFSYVLWAVVLFRLLCPVSFTAPVSLLGALQNETGGNGRVEYIPQDIGMQENPQITLPLPVSDDPAGNRVNLPSAAPENSVNPLQAALSVGTVIWVLGIDGMAVYSIVSMLRLKKRLRAAVPEGENAYRCGGISTAFVYGILRPRIYLPEGLTAEEENFVLLHEQIHIRRKDPVWRLLAWTALCLHWFNPLVWLAFALSGQDMEMACDEAVIAGLGERAKKGYSSALLSLAEGRRGLLSGAPLSFSEGGTGGRIRNVLRYRKPRRTAAVILMIVCVAAAVFLLANPGRENTETVYYGVVGYAEMEGESLPVVVSVPGLGDMMIPESGEFVPYEGEEAEEPVPGDLIRLTFSAEELMIGETYPSVFIQEPDRIEILGHGFALRHTETDLYQLTFLSESAAETEAGDRLDIRRQSDGAELADNVPVVAVDGENGQIRAEFSTEQVRAVLEAYSSGLEISVMSGNEETPETTGVGASAALDEENMAYERAVQSEEMERKREEQERTYEEADEILPENGWTTVTVRSVSSAYRWIDEYDIWANEYFTWSSADEGFHPLFFAQDCAFYVNRSVTSLDYQQIDYDEYIELTEEILNHSQYSSKKTQLLLENGEIVEAYLPGDCLPYGFCYSPEPRTLEEQLTEFALFTELSWEEMLETYYAPVRSEQADVAEAEGIEQITVYSGDIGDGDSGFVLIQDAEGELLFSMGAYRSTPGNNNIYLGERNGIPFLMTVFIEERGVFGGYSYHVFRLDAENRPLLAAGSSFSFDVDLLYDDDMFRQWVDEMTGWLEDGELLLSIQDDELRTDPVSDADRYNYDTLSETPRLAFDQRDE